MSFGQSDALTAVLRVGAALDALAVTYAIGGSFASSVQGVFRTTNDVDVVACLRDEHVEADSTSTIFERPRRRWQCSTSSSDFSRRREPWRVTGGAK